MTSEQIAELRKLHDGVIAQALPEIANDRTLVVQVYKENAAFMIACNNSLRRLLDEREALLKALHAAFDALEIAGEGRFHQDALQAAGDAIVKAESP